MIWPATPVELGLMLADQTLLWLAEMELIFVIVKPEEGVVTRTDPMLMPASDTFVKTAVKTTDCPGLTIEGETETTAVPARRARSSSRSSIIGRVVRAGREGSANKRSKA